MGKNIIKLHIAAILIAATVVVPQLSRAQDTTSTNAPAVAPAVTPTVSDQTTNAPVKKARKRDHSVFNGKLTEVDTNAMTFTVGKRTFEVTSETKIEKAGQPATLSDGTVGEPAGGTYKKTNDGKLDAISVRFGDKKKKEASDSSAK
jgi:hypothetical protein